MRKFLVLGILILAFLAIGCGKQPAQKAIQWAEAAVNDAQPSVEKYVPEQYTELKVAVADAKKKFDAGQYKEALAAAEPIPAKAKEAMTAAAAKKDELTTKWNDMQVNLPPQMQLLTTKIDALASFKKLPKEIDKTQFETAKASMPGITDGFNAATAAFGEGDLPGAVAKAEEAKAKADELAKLLEPINVGTK